MWCLELEEGEVTYSLTPGKVHTVSRKVGDIVVAHDQSVSRKHAYLQVAKDGVLVWDDTSKFGTFVNENIESSTELAKNVKVLLKEGGRVRFGLQQSIWRLKHKPLHVCVGNLKAAEKSQLKSTIKKLGGKLSDKWSDSSSHLTVNSLSLTLEVISALASGKPIVTPPFWQCYNEMMSGNGGTADPAKFIPPLEDKKLLGKENLCLPNFNRKTLFKGKIFVFPTSETFQQLQEVVTVAGGKALELAHCKISIDEFCEPNVIVIKCEEDKQTKLYKKVCAKLSGQDRKVVPAEDIGLAIWKISTLVHCNPSFSPSDLLRKPESHPHDDSGSTTLVTNTEDISNAPKRVKRTSQIIPPSLTSNNSCTEDQTMTMSIQKTQPFPKTSAEDRARNCIAAGPSKVPIENNSFIKIEPSTLGEEEEDLFAMEDLSVVDKVSKKIEHNKAQTREAKRPRADDNDDFFLPSPPKRKRGQKVAADDEDAFLLPMPPPTQSARSRDEDDDFSALSSLPVSRSSKKLNSSIDQSTTNLNFSRDLFEPTQESNRGTCLSMREGKRKGRSDSETEDPPPKRPSNVLTDLKKTHHDVTSVKNSAGFLSKSTIPSVKKEEDKMLEGAQVNGLAVTFEAKVVVTSLLKSQDENNTGNSSKVNDTSSCGKKNFKKFKKVWAGSSNRSYFTTVAVEPNAGGRLSLARDEEEEEEDNEDDPFPVPQGGRRNRNIANDEDDEFALPSFSQFS